MAAVSLNGADIITEMGDHHLIAVDGGDIKRIKAADLGIGGGGGGSGPQLVPHLSGVPTVAAGAHNLRGMGFKATGNVSIKGIWAIMVPPNAGTFSWEILLATMTNTTTVGTIIERKTVSGVAGINEPLLLTAELTTPQAYVNNDLFAVMIRDPAVAGNINTRISQANVYTNFYPLPIAMDSTNAWIIRDALADIANGGTVTRLNGNMAHQMGVIV